MANRKLVLVDFDRYTPADRTLRIGLLCYAAFGVMALAYAVVGRPVGTVTAVLAMILSFLIAHAGLKDKRSAQRIVDEEVRAYD